MTDRGAIEVETLLKIILVLVVVWLALEIVGQFVRLVFSLFGPLRYVLGLVIVVLIVLWLLDRI